MISMTSTRTQYRQKRIQLIKDSIALLLDMLTMEKKELEKIHISKFKKIKKEILAMEKVF